MGYLYIVRCGDSGYYKIGIATDVETRLASLQTGSPYELKVVDCYEFQYPQSIETSLHNKFCSKNKLGEWFCLDTSDLREISKVCLMLGGNRKTDTVFASDDDVRKAETVAESQFFLKPRDNSVYDGEGFRMQLAGDGNYKHKYYQWVRGSGSNREYKKGGLVRELSDDIRLKLIGRLENNQTEVCETETT